ncbi:MAG TPA: 5-(carboxyamino)imidazole ribonucleotide mutase [bacterium]|jgi:5-(carboxyamino)imidazole ribonucleotide mutase|nr:5-(carboxyamino)imidazole ribonucleotide mutase [bacterium]
MEKTLVGIIMGSDSDLDVMRPAADILTELGVASELRVVSAHRTPLRAMQYAQEAEGRGLKVIIAGAGGAAHLPGVTAALTALPVVGVPVLGKALNGLDSLLSIVQMPAGVPVATVGVNAGKNAGLLAAQMISLADPALATRLKAWRKSNEDKVAAVDKRWQEQGASKPA